MHKERRKKEEEKNKERTKSVFSCLFFSAFVWASGTLEAFLTTE